MTANPDVPTLDACRKLAEAGWPQGGSGPWWFVPKVQSGVPMPALLWTLNPGSILGDWYAAPSIGTLLAYCRERGWLTEIHHGCTHAGYTSVYLWPEGITRSQIGTHKKEPANALAEALAAALAAEKGGA